MNYALFTGLLMHLKSKGAKFKDKLQGEENREKDIEDIQYLGVQLDKQVYYVHVKLKTDWSCTYAPYSH